MLVSNNQAAAEREHFSIRAVAERDLELSNKEEELCSLVEEHITAGTESLLALEDKVSQQSEAIKTNSVDI